MSSLLETYEHQYSAITAEITSQISRIPNLSSTDSKKDAISAANQQLEEAKELLEQMEIEIRGIPTEQRSKYTNRHKSYVKELSRLEAEFRRSKIAFSDKATRDELLNGGDVVHYENHRVSLLDNTERLERSGKAVDRSYQVCIETEEIGGQILEDLNSQREQINKSREKLKETDAILGKSSRVLSGMARRIVQNKLVLAVIIAFLIIIVVVGIYFAVKRKQS